MITKTKQKKVYIETLGCQMNKSDSELMLGLLVGMNYAQTNEVKDSDLAIINTCSIRALSENKAYSYLGVWNKIKKKNPDFKMAICGCVAQQTKEKIFAKAPYVDLVFGTHNIKELPELIKRLENGEKKVCSVLQKPYEKKKEVAPIRKKGISAWLPIIEGCDYFCTYCVVPYTRGRQRSRDFSTIIAEAKSIADEGFREITLLGQTVDSYGNDIGDENVNLANLLRELNKIEGLWRIRFMTSYPTEITDDLIKAVSELDKVCEYFHIPMQSGNDRVLEKMRRVYTRGEYVDIVNKIRKNIPDVAVTSDFIAGFPTEAEGEFNDTLSIIDELVFDHCNTAAYSPRRQTPAAVWKEQIAFDEKKRRLALLNSKIKESAKLANEKYIGRELEVLVERQNEKNTTILTGRTRNNKLVHFRGDKNLINTLVGVKIGEASAWCLKGSLLSDNV